MSKGGRPEKEISWPLVEKFLEAGCSAKEIASKFRMKVDTFYTRFKKHYRCSFQDYRVMGDTAGKADIRLALHSKALNDGNKVNTKTLIFLAKCRLGMVQPEATQSEAANQKEIDLTHQIMQLQNKIVELEKNGNKSETE